MKILFSGSLSMLDEKLWIERDNKLQNCHEVSTESFANPKTILANANPTTNARPLEVLLDESY